MKILIVEDENDIIKMLEYNLEREGFKTLSARDGEDALDLAKSRRPDLILLDLMLPGIDGLEVCKELSSEGKYEYGLKGLAKLLGCSVSKASEIKSSGILNNAIIQRGNIIKKATHFSLYNIILKGLIVFLQIFRIVNFIIAF